MDLQQRMERAPLDDLREIGVRFTGSEGRGNDWALVLASAGIGHRLERTLGGWQLLVLMEDLARAGGALDAYDRENPAPGAAAAAVAPAREYGGSYHVGVIFALALVGFHAVVRAGLGVPWLAAGTSSAEQVMHGQWYRVVTALTLHGDLAHVLGNAAAGGLFLTLLAQRLGPGVAVALTLATGAIGNAANALAHHLGVGHGPVAVGHHSIGASTALFGAVAVLGAVQAVRGRRGSRWPSWVPLAASLGLLAMLGAADGDPLDRVLGAGRGVPHTDLLAHLFGFLAGVGLGLGAAYGLRRPPSRAWQAALVLGSLLAVSGCWALALLHR